MTCTRSTSRLMCASHATHPPSLCTSAASGGPAASQQSPAAYSVVQNSTVRSTAAKPHLCRVADRQPDQVRHALPFFVRHDPSRTRSKPQTKENRKNLENGSARTVWQEIPVPAPYVVVLRGLVPLKKSFLSDKSPGITRDTGGINSGPTYIPKENTG